MKMKLYIFKRYKNEDHGTAAIEFAFISLIFITIVFGIFETGRVFWTLNSLQFAAEQASRYALVDSDATEDEIIEKFIENMNRIEITEGNPEITVSQDVDINGINFAIVDATYTFTTYMPFLPANLGTLSLDASSRQAVYADDLE